MFLKRNKKKNGSRNDFFFFLMGKNEIFCLELLLKHFRRGDIKKRGEFKKQYNPLTIKVRWPSRLLMGLRNWLDPMKKKQTKEKTTITTTMEASHSTCSPSPHTMTNSVSLSGYLLPDRLCRVCASARVLSGSAEMLGYDIQTCLALLG